MYFKVELNYIIINLTNNCNKLLKIIQSIEKYLENKPKFDEKVDVIYMSDCPMPIDYELDLSVLEDNTLCDQVFKIFVIKYYLL